MDARPLIAAVNGYSPQIKILNYLLDFPKFW